MYSNSLTMQYLKDPAGLWWPSWRRWVLVLYKSKLTTLQLRRNMEPHSITLRALTGNVAQKWLGCMWIATTDPWFFPTPSPANPLWVFRRALPGQSDNQTAWNLFTLGMNEQHMLYRVRPVHSMFTNGLFVTKKYLVCNFLMLWSSDRLWLHSWFVLELGTAKFIQVNFENLTCIVGNCFDVLCVRHLTSIGTSRGIQSSMHGTDGLIKNWIAMVSKYGHQNICLNIGHFKLRCLASWQSLGETHFALEPTRWKAWTVILPMANSNTKFLPLASVGPLAWYCPKHWSLVPILPRLHFLCLAMMLFSRCRV